MNVFAPGRRTLVSERRRGSPWGAPRASLFRSLGNTSEKPRIGDWKTPLRLRSSNKQKEHTQNS
jgi:hypothetical protein